MKKLIIIFFLLTCSVFAQKALQVFKNGDLADTYILIGSGTNTIERTYARLVDSVLYIPYKMKGDSLYSYSGGGVTIEDIDFSNGTIDVPGRIITYAGIEGGDTLYIDGYLELAVLDTADADSGQVVQFNGTSAVWATISGGSADTTHYVAFAKVTGLQDSLDAVQSDIAGISGSDTTHIVAFSAVTGLQDTVDGIQSDVATNTAHSSSNGTDHSYIDQPVTTTSTPQLAKLGLAKASSSYILDVLGSSNFNGTLYGNNASNYIDMVTSGNFTIKSRGSLSYYFDSDNNSTSNYFVVATNVADTKFQVFDDSTVVKDDLYVEGKIMRAGINTHTIVGDTTLTASMMYGGVFYVTSAATLTLPAVASGMNISVITIGAIAVSVDPNASDKLWLDGTALDDGDKATNTSTAGDIAVVTYYSADGWYVSSNSWTDGS